MIKVIDNFLCDDVVVYLNGIIRKIDYIPIASHKNHLNANLFRSNPKEHPGHDIFDYILHKIIKLDYFKFHNIQEISVNKYPAGKSGQGDWHHDYSPLTAVYYPCYWESQWEGKTEFEDGKNVDYKQNRLIIFPRTSVKHKGGLHNNPYDFRYTVAFKIDGNIV